MANEHRCMEMLTAKWITDMNVVELQFVHVVVNLDVLIIEHTEHRAVIYDRIVK